MYLITTQMYVPELSEKQDKVTYLIRERKKETPSLMVAKNMEHMILYRVVET